MQPLTSQALVCDAGRYVLRPLGLGVVAAARHVRHVQPMVPLIRSRTLATARGSQDDDTGRPRPEVSAPRTWGDKLMLAGASSMIASTVVRTASYAQFLRFAGPGPMLVGAVLSVYELGGWRLLLALPATAGAVAGVGRFAGSMREASLKDEATQELREQCPELPCEALDAIRATPAREYETNRLRLEVEWAAGASTGPDEVAALAFPKWQVMVEAVRDSPLAPWRLTALRASRALRARPSFEQGQLPPQTRFWGSALEWQIVWQRS